MLTHSAFLPVTGLLLMNKEIGQSTLRTYGPLLHMLNLHIVVWFFSLSCVKVQNVCLYYVKFVCGLIAISRHLPPRPPPSSSVTFVYCIQRAEDIVKHLPRPGSPTIPLFFNQERRYLISRNTPSAVISYANVLIGSRP